MYRILTLKRPFIWLARFRKRCGYGIHSPSSFDFVKNVIYEKTPYYAYGDIEKSKIYGQLKLREKKKHVSRKVCRLLFRMVNRFQPATIAEIGAPTSITSLYLKAGRKDVDYSDQLTEKHYRYGLDFLFVHYSKDVESVREIIMESLNHATNESVYVIEGICYDSYMKQLWKEIMDHPYTVVTYDLYDVGIIFFDLKRTKQHYIVNF